MSLFDHATFLMFDLVCHMILKLEENSDVMSNGTDCCNFISSLLHIRASVHPSVCVF